MYANKSYNNPKTHDYEKFKLLQVLVGKAEREGTDTERRQVAQ